MNKRTSTIGCVSSFRINLCGLANFSVKTNANWCEKDQLDKVGKWKIYVKVIIELTNAEIDFIINGNGSVLVNEKEMDKAVMCCS